MPLLLNKIGSTIIIMLNNAINKLPKFSFTIVFIVALYLVLIVYGISKVRISFKALNTTITWAIAWVLTGVITKVPL